MLTLVAEHVVKAPPRVVWQVLTDFASYPRWTGAATLTPAPDRPAEVTYALRVTSRGGRERTWAFAGRIRAFDPPRLFAWTSSLPGLIGLAIRFEVTPEAGATRVRHVARVSGVVAAIRPNLTRRVFQPVLERMLCDLEAEARRRERKGPSGGPPKPPHRRGNPRH